MVRILGFFIAVMLLLPAWSLVDSVETLPLSADDVQYFAKRQCGQFFLTHVLCYYEIYIIIIIIIIIMAVFMYMLLKFQFIGSFYFAFGFFMVPTSYILFVLLLCSQLEKASMILQGATNEENENDPEKWQKFREFVILHQKIIKWVSLLFQLIYGFSSSYY